MLCLLKNLGMYFWETFLVGGCLYLKTVSGTVIAIKIESCLAKKLKSADHFTKLSLFFWP